MTSPREADLRPVRKSKVACALDEGAETRGSTLKKGGDRRWIKKMSELPAHAAIKERKERTRLMDSL